MTCGVTDYYGTPYNFLSATRIKVSRAVVDWYHQLEREEASGSLGGSSRMQSIAIDDDEED